MSWERSHWLWQVIDLGTPTPDDLDWNYYPADFDEHQYFGALSNRMVRPLEKFQHLWPVPHRPDTVTITTTESRAQSYFAPGATYFRALQEPPKLMFIEVHDDAALSSVHYSARDQIEIAPEKKAYQVLDLLGGDYVQTIEEIQNEWNHPELYETIRKTVGWVQLLPLSHVQPDRNTVAWRAHTCPEVNPEEVIVRKSAHSRELRKSREPLEIMHHGYPLDAAPNEEEAIARARQLVQSEELGTYAPLLRIVKAPGPGLNKKTVIKVRPRLSTFEFGIINAQNILAADSQPKRVYAVGYMPPLY